MGKKYLIFFLIFLLDFIIVTINLIQLLVAILIRINYLSIYLESKLHISQVPTLKPKVTIRKLLAYKAKKKLKKSSGRLLATNWRNIVTRGKFLVASLFNVNDATHSTVQSIRFDCFGINLEVTWLITKAKQAKIKCLF